MIPGVVVIVSRLGTVVVAAESAVGTAGATIGPILPRLEHRRQIPRKVVPFFTP